MERKVNVVAERGRPRGWHSVDGTAAGPDEVLTYDFFQHDVIVVL